jgi:UDP-glucose 4-epimerase
VNSGVLVTGATGFVGKALLQRLLATERQPLVAAVRNKNTNFASRLRAEQVGELSLTTDWMACLQGVDVVIHCAARAHLMQDRSNDPLAEYRKVNVEGTFGLARQAAQAGVRRFVFLSSIKVSGECTGSGKAFSAADLPAPEDPYGVSKFEAEQALVALSRETRMEIVIIRPPLVYGPGVKGNFAQMVRWLRSGMPLPLGAVYNRRSLVALDNLVDFIALCADVERSPLAANQVFLISDEEDVSTTELLRKVGYAYGVTPRLLPVPVHFIQLVASALGKRIVADRLLGSLVVDTSKARELLGWRPVVSIDEQLKKMALHDSGI